jgi:surfactin synthase thioesterase subunit
MLTMFCLPFAGGDANSYTPFNRLSDASLEVIALELPGRRIRFNEKLLESVDQMAEDYLNQLKGYRDSPYVIFGHSMGALIGFVMIRKMISRGMKVPMHFFASGFASPSVALTDARKRMPGKEELKEKMRETMEIPVSFLNSALYPLIYEPVLCCDLKALKNYQYFSAPPFNIPITVFIGNEDEVTIEEAWSWQEETSKTIIRENSFDGTMFK